MTDYPDFTVIARLKGEYAGLEKAVALDSEGALQALLYGTYGGANKKMLVDTDGNAQMNLYAQNLEEVINRFKYGAPISLYVEGVMGNQGYNTVFDITGKGYVYYLDMSLDGGSSHKTDNVLITLDGVGLPTRTFEQLMDTNKTDLDDYYMCIKQYDDVEFKYRLVGLRGFTFESSILVRYRRTVADNPQVLRMLLYTLI